MTHLLTPIIKNIPSNRPRRFISTMHIIITEVINANGKILPYHHVYSVENYDQNNYEQLTIRNAVNIRLYDLICYTL